MNESLTNFVPDRLNEPPSVFGGCSWEELGALATASASASLVLGIILAFLVHWIVIFAVLVSGTLLGVYAGSKLMLTAKQGRPPGYFKTRIHLQLQDWGLTDRKSITRSRVWDIRSE